MMRRKLYGLSNDKSSRIVKWNNSLKEPRAYSTATSRGSPAELQVFRALPISAISAHYEMKILIN